MEILKCEGVRKVYGSGNNQVVALDRIDLTVNKGEFVAIIGASGSGKSTLLHILGSVDQPTEGKVIVEGTDISTMNRTQAAIFRRRKVGLVYQFYNLIPTLTVRKNILMPLLLDKRKPNQEYFQQVIQSLGITDKLEALPNQLSGGQQQQLAIARAVAAEPALLILDEPTEGIQPSVIQEIGRVITELKSRMAVLIVEQYLEFVMEIADYCYVMENGRIIMDGEPEELDQEKLQATMSL